MPIDRLCQTSRPAGRSHGRQAPPIQRYQIGLDFHIMGVGTSSNIPVS